MKYISQGNLSIAPNLFDFVNNELLPDTDVSSDRFWNGFDEVVHELTPKNRELLDVRNKMKKKIDKWHLDNKDKEFNLTNYTNFLKEIGYLAKEGENFSIETKNVDTEISNIDRPQLVLSLLHI